MAGLLTRPSSDFATPRPIQRANTQPIPRQPTGQSRPNQIQVSSTATGVDAQAAQREVSPQELSRNQLNIMLGEDSPLMQRAQTEGAQYAASRGLLNSSIGGHAAQGAMIDRATPFALQDASTYTNVYDKNLAAKNEFGLGRQRFGFDVTLQGNDQTWRSGENALDRSLTSSESALERANRIAMQESQQGWTTGENALDRSQQTSLQESAQNWTSGESALQRGMTTSENALDRAQQTQVQQTAIAADEARLAQAAALEIQRLGYTFELDKYNVSMSFAATTAQNTMTAINGYLGDANLDAKARSAAIGNAVAIANEQLAWASTFYNMPVPSLTTPTSQQVGITPQPLGYNDRLVVEGDIASIYKNVLGRDADAQGLKYWGDQAVRNGWTENQLREAILNAAPETAPEPTPQETTEASVKSIYETMLGHTPDVEGLAYWSNQAITNNWTTEQLQAAIMQSAADIAAA